MYPPLNQANAMIAEVIGDLSFNTNGEYDALIGKLFRVAGLIDRCDHLLEPPTEMPPLTPTRKFEDIAPPKRRKQQKPRAPKLDPSQYRLADCPTCEAVVGEPCFSTSFDPAKKVTMVHKDRVIGSIHDARKNVIRVHLGLMTGQS